MNDVDLADRLLAAVRAQRFEATPDAMQHGGPVTAFPSIDLALAVFPPGGAPVCANVLFSREHPHGHAARLDARRGALRGLRFDADLTGAGHASIAWLPGADWARLPWQVLAGEGPLRFVAPYPASLVKLMVAVGVALAVDRGACGFEEAWSHGARERSVDAWCEDMVATSSNEATAAMVALLHARGLIARGAGGELRNDLHEAFAALDLPTLRLAETRPGGGWRNADGAGVGRLQMTAWDSVRLLWLLDDDAPPAPWLAPGTPALLSAAGRRHIGRWLARQGLHEILSSTALAGTRGWVRGLPARMPSHWIGDDGSARVGNVVFDGDLRPANAEARVEFRHKTGLTENYASDAGIVRALAPGRRHYIVALLSNLGTRYSDGPVHATTRRIAALGAAIDGAIADWID